MSYSMCMMFKIKKEFFTIEQIENFVKLVSCRKLEAFSRINADALRTRIDRFYNKEVGGGLSLDLRDSKGKYHEFILELFTKNRFKTLPLQENQYYLYLSSPLMYFEGPNSDKHLEYFFDYVKLVAMAFKPECGRGGHELTFDHFNYDLERIYWLNFFSPERVKEIGREKLLSAPAYQVEELEDGGIILLATKEQSSAGPEITDKIAKHLGLLK